MHGQPQGDQRGDARRLRTYAGSQRALPHDLARIAKKGGVYHQGRFPPALLDAHGLSQIRESVVPVE